MKNFRVVMDKVGKELQEMDSVREKALAVSRDVILACRKGIQSIHRKDFDNARKLITSASRKLKTLFKIVESYPDLKSAGFVENAAQEVVEAKCIYNLVMKRDMPDPDRIGVTPTVFLLGLCDAVGELRRFSLDSMREGKVDEANFYLKMMEDIYDSVMTFDYPPSIKRKQDIARGLIEKTKSELAVASCERRIQDKIEEFRGFLDQVEKIKNIGKKGREEADLNLDEVW